MDPVSILGLTASVIACIQLSGSLLARLRPSNHSREELNRILKTLCGFRGALEGLKTHIEFNVDDGERLSAVNHLEAPLTACKEALELVTQRLNAVSFVGKYIVGSVWDGTLRKALQRLDEAKDLLELSMHADQRVIMAAVEQYVRSISSDVHRVQECVNENGKRILALDEKVHDIVDGLDQVETKRDAKRRHHETQSCLESAWQDLKIQQLHSDVLKWLFHSDPNINHNAACEKRNDHTGLWFIQDARFEKWRKTSGSVIWLHGIPGCGKTILSSTIIRELQHNLSSRNHGNMTKPTVVFYYFSFSDPAKQTVRNFLNSALLQLIQKRDSLHKSLCQLYDEYRLAEPPLARVVDALQSALVSAGDVFIVLDALDECPLQNDERPLLLSTLSQVIGWRIPGLRVLVTSRDDDDIQRYIKGLLTMEAISIQGEAVSSDIRSHVQKELDAEFLNHGWPADLKPEVEEALVDGAQGVFRWVSLQLATIKNCKRPIDVRRELKLLPKTIDETYERILLEIEEPYREYVIRALHWLAFAGRALRAEELFEAVVMKPGVVAQFQRLDDTGFLVKSLSSLISVVNREITTDDHDYSGKRYGDLVDDVKLAHYSVQEFLTSQRIQEGPASPFWVNAGNSHALIAEACLRYLLMFDKRDSICGSSLREWRLLSYAARNWYVHVRQAADESQVYLAELAARLLTMQLLPVENQLPLKNWLRVFDPGAFSQSAFEVMPAEKTRPHAGIYYASCLGLIETARLLLSREKMNLNASWGNIRGCLPAAADGGYDDIIEMLLDHGADMRNQSQNGQNALERAVWGPHISTIRLLLSRGALVRAKGSRGATALHCAARAGTAEVCELLISHGANIGECDKGGCTPLHDACGYRLGEAVIPCLIRHGAEVRVLDSDNNTPLHNASMNCSSDTINLLLSKGAEKDALNNQGTSPLRNAIDYYNHEAAYTLLQHGSRILYRDSESEEEGDEPIDTLLKLSRSMPTDDYEGPYDIEKDSSDLVTRVLLEYGYGLESDYGDLLLLAASRGWDQTAEYLLTQAKVNPLHRNADGETALHIVIKIVSEDGCLGYFEFTCPWIRRLERIISLLLDRGGRKMTQAPDNNQKTPLQTAFDLGWQNALAQMIRHGAPHRRVRLKRSHTWAHLAAELHIDGQETLELIRALGARGEDFKVRDPNDGKAPVHYAFRNPPTIEMLQALVDVGADLKMTTEKTGETILHLYAQISSIWDDQSLDNAVDIVRFAVAHGVDLMAKDSEGRTAIDISEEQFRPQCDYSRKVLSALETVAKELGMSGG